MTTEAKHDNAWTPEPWIICTDSSKSGSAIGIRGDNRNVAGMVSYDDARRIVACVNACAGISTDALESGVSCVHTARKNMNLRDELADSRTVEAAREVLNSVRP